MVRVRRLADTMRCSFRRWHQGAQACSAEARPGVSPWWGSIALAVASFEAVTIRR